LVSEGQEISPREEVKKYNTTICQKNCENAVSSAFGSTRNAKDKRSLLRFRIKLMVIEHSQTMKRPSPIMLLYLRW